jgi:hypothetical protein
VRKDDPYAGLYVETDKDPYAGLFVEEIKTSRAKAPRTGMDKATQVAGVTSGALLPYATAAGAGALAGAPFAGVGAVPGAAGGVLALGAGDLGTSLYNMGASLFGGDRVPLPSETIRQGYEVVGVGRQPETSGEQVYNDILQAGAAGFNQAKGFQTLADVAASPQSQNFMRMMGQNARGQTGAAIGAAGAPSVASNYFDVTNPYALAWAFIGWRGTGAKVATPTPKPVTAAALKEESGKLYRAMEAENVNIAPQAMTDLGVAARTKLSTLRYDPDTDKVVNEALKLFDVKSGKPMTFDMLEKFRRSVRDLPYSEAGGKRGTPDERAMVKALEEVIDDFMDGLTPAQTTSGNAAAANAFLTQARGVRGRGYQTETLENAFTAATRTSSTADSTKSFPRALRDEFAKIAKNERKLSRFDKPTQELIKKVANGTVTQKILMTLGNLSPSARLFGTQMPLYGAGYGGLATLSPTTAAVVGGTQTAAAIAKGAANRMTRTQANRALVSAAQPGGGIKPGGQGFFALSPVAQQNVLAQDRAKRAEERRRLGF